MRRPRMIVIRCHIYKTAIQLEGKSIFSKVDLVMAYNRVPMNATDIAKTAIVTPFGLFEFKRMPFADLPTVPLSPYLLRFAGS